MKGIYYTFCRFLLYLFLFLEVIVLIFSMLTPGEGYVTRIIFFATIGIIQYISIVVFLMYTSAYRTIIGHDIPELVYQISRWLMLIYGVVLGLGLVKFFKSLYGEFGGNLSETMQNVCLCSLWCLYAFSLFCVFWYTSSKEKQDTEYKGLIKRSLKMKLEQSKRSGVFSLDEMIVPESWGISFSDDGSVPFEEIKKHLLQCDYLRFGFHEYELPFIEDLSKGHWELWDNEEENGTKVNLPTKIIARNPEKDILPNSVVSIDFGTKSTVVVRLENGELHPVRIGVTNLFKPEEPKHYENPTCMEFRDLDKFKDAYDQKKGRPETRWEWLTISHSAVESLLGAESKDYSAYLSELKQWAGDGNETLQFKDKKEKNFTLDPYNQLDEDSFDPIEIYAYLLGLNINNMIRKICMKYILSYPVTYTLETRDRLKRSFEKGLKQSLPSALRKNEDAMKKFSIVFGASEPAAYAVCALKQYGFDPSDNEVIRYGVFDFGGGTTDFDFGIWRSANKSDRKEQSYSYVIEHFNTAGDPKLGGENILQRIAFEAFKQNIDLCRENRIAFMKVDGGVLTSEFEGVVDDDAIARKNMKAMAEELRGLWEHQEGWESKYEGGMLKVDLWNRERDLISGLEILIDVEQLEQIIIEKINDGIKRFFLELERTMENHPEFKKGQGKIEIFLAGNSSRSERVTRIFNEKMKEYSDDPEVVYFELLPPLGTPESLEIQRNRNVVVNEKDVELPTGKTGVAFGLLMARDSDDVKVINKDDNSFQYFVGEKSKKYFRPILKPGCDLGEWMPMEKTAHSATIEIYYTKLADAEDGKMPIGEASTIHVDNPLDEPDDDKSVFIRASDPKNIELVIGDEEDGQLVEPVTEPISIHLGE